MEDMGDDKFFDLIQSGSKQPPELLTLAVDALIAKFHADPTIALDGCIAYADEYWLFRIEQFLKHYMPLVRKQPVTDTARAEYLGVFKAALDRAHVLPNILLHGDYGVQNLMYMAGRPGIKAVGMVDFQDMTDARGNMSGSPAFDLMFLIRDVRADFSDELMEQMRERFFQGSGLTDRVQFDYECSAIVAAQSAKCLGLFARFGIGNNRPEYLPFLANCWRHLRWALGHPDLAQVKRWFEQNGGLE
jgi:aminoglycoside/choline kinase family phosphotransferase